MKVYILFNIFDSNIKGIYKTEELAKHHRDLINSQSVDQSPFAYYEEFDIKES